MRRFQSADVLTRKQNAKDFGKRWVRILLFEIFVPAEVSSNRFVLLQVEPDPRQK